MAKYEITRTGGPAYQEARESNGLHVHADASTRGSDTHIGIQVERVYDGTTETLGTERRHVEAETVQVGEAKALLLGVVEAMRRRQGGEHLFAYTDSDALLSALYGSGRGLAPAVDDIANTVVDRLPGPQNYSIVLCRSSTNPAHEVARGEEL